MTRSASRSTSLSTCELTITVRPSAPSWRNRAISCTRCTGSAPFSGSSSTSTAGPVHQRGGDLGALAHALAEAVDAPVGDVEQADRRQRGVGRAAVGDAVEVGDVADELAGRQRRRDGLVLRHEGHAPVDAAVAPGIATLDAHGALVDPEHPGDRPHQRRLAGAVRPEQPGDARAERAAQLGQRDLRAEPHRHVADLDGRLGANAGSTRPSGGCARAIAGLAGARSSGCPRCARSSFHPPVAPQQHADAGQQHDDVRADRQRPAVLDAGRAASRGRRGRGRRGRGGTAAGRAR